MKCVIDLDLLLPPPVPGTMHFEEMALHDQNLKRFDIKVALSFGIMGKLWATWSSVTHPQHKKFLQSILTRHFTKDCPNVSIELSECSMTPSFLPVASELNEWVEEWLGSLAACYADQDFNTGGAVLASWARHEFADRQTIEFKCPQVFEHIPIKRTQEEWDLLTASLAQSPISYSSALNVYADESGDRQHAEWIGIVVISESDANQIIRAAIAEFNRSRSNEQAIHTVHFSELSSEPDRLVLAASITEKLCRTQAACFIVHRNPKETENHLYARGLGEVLAKWRKLLEPIRIDTPYDRENDDRKNRDLQNQIQQVVQSKGFSCTTDSIILGKPRDYPGLGLADAIAYLYLHKSKPQWRDIWQQLDQRGKYFSI
jgi:hypothetical protein